MAASPSSLPFLSIAASPHDRNLLSASSAWIPPPTAAQRAAFSARTGRLLPSEQHAVSLSDLALWRSEHPTERLRPPVGTDAVMLKNYRAPQHPASHVLHSIPPRAPSRSSRSNILSYTIHLATSSRLSAYSSAAGSRQLLHLAELERDTQDGIDIDEEWFAAEQKTQGLWKLGVNLLQSSRREGGVLPPSVERRVDLAGLAEDMLLSPAAERAVTKIDAESVQPSAEVDDLVALKPLTAPDATTHYHTTSAAPIGDDLVAGGHQRVTSVAQSLIDLKFGGKADPSELSPSFLDDKPLADTPESFAGVPSSSTAATAVAGPSTTPHMDYRIVLSQSMRTRARAIYATSPLPALPASYCRRHRVRSCAVCAALIAVASERESDHAAMRRLNVPGAGLCSAGAAAGNAKKPLVALVPAFLKLSAALLEDARERAGGAAAPELDEALIAEVVTPSTARAGAKGKSRTTDDHGPAGADGPRGRELHVTAEWYDLLSALLVQACLEGYLVDGWTGTDGVETLFGVGCGVWEGRGWSAPTPAVAAAHLQQHPRRDANVDAHAGGVEDDEDWSESDDDDDGVTNAEAERARKRESETRALVDAAKLLFGSRDVAQADYERGMRDRTHEFLNVPQSKDLHQHLDALSVKYPLSQLEDAMVDFIEAAVRLLGKPTLAKHDPRTAAAAATAAASSSASSSGPTLNAAAASSADPDPYALVQYFAPARFATVPSLHASPRTASPADAAETGDARAGKRRRVD
ncbi:hypothetical protein JCM3770_003124 [Rhodotorula araucariae]